MTTTILHFQHSRFGQDRVACGRYVEHRSRRTRDADTVTCQRCLSTEVWLLAHHADKARLAVAMPESNLTPVQNAVKAALDAVFERAHSEATDQGVCDTYDEIIGNIADELPAWYSVPKRARSWKVGNKYPTDVFLHDMNEDEAWAAIAANPKAYVELSTY